LLFSLISLFIFISFPNPKPLLYLLKKSFISDLLTKVILPSLDLVKIESGFPPITEFIL
jgi:hypothetical protein